MLAVEPGGVALLERGVHRTDVAQHLGDLLDVLAALEHAGAGGGDVGVVGEHVPRAPDDVVERGERHEVLDQRAALVGALAEADRAHLRQAADRLAHAPLDQLHAGDEGGGDGPEADGEHAEAAGSGSDVELGHAPNHKQAWPSCVKDEGSLNYPAPGVGTASRPDDPPARVPRGGGRRTDVGGGRAACRRQPVGAVAGAGRTGAPAGAVAVRAGRPSSGAAFLGGAGARSRPAGAGADGRSGDVVGRRARRAQRSGAGRDDRCRRRRALSGGRRGVPRRAARRPADADRGTVRRAARWGARRFAGPRRVRVAVLAAARAGARRAAPGAAGGARPAGCEGRAAGLVGSVGDVPGRLAHEGR